MQEQGLIWNGSEKCGYLLEHWPKASKKDQEEPCKSNLVFSIVFMVFRCFSFSYVLFSFFSPVNLLILPWTSLSPVASVPRTVCFFQGPKSRAEKKCPLHPLEHGRGWNLLRFVGAWLFALCQYTPTSLIYIHPRDSGGSICQLQICSDSFEQVGRSDLLIAFAGCNTLQYSVWMRCFLAESSLFPSWLKSLGCCISSQLFSFRCRSAFRAKSFGRKEKDEESKEKAVERVERVERVKDTVGSQMASKSWWTTHLYDLHIIYNI